MKVLVVIAAACISQCWAKFSFSDCGTPSTAITLNGLLLPDTVYSGERYHMKANLTVLERIDGCSVTATYTANRADSNGDYQPFTKCYGDFGSCAIEMCQRPGFPTFNPLYYVCKGNGISGSSYVAPGTYTIDRHVFFPGLSGREIDGVKGKFQGQTLVKDSQGNQLGCWNISFDLEEAPKTC